MPPYRRYYYNRRYQTNRRRRWFPRRRTRKTLRRRWRHKRKFKPRYKVKKHRHYKKKKKTISIKMFQPTTINSCKIIGYKCLLQGSILRCNNNFVQYIYSFIPDKQPGGGGWSIQVMSLDSLYEEYLHLQNVWTKGNAGLPLVRYLGTQFKLYQSKETDYVFMYDNCWPMVDTIHTHADSAPFRMLQHKNKIVVPSRNTQNRKKPYKKLFIRPPSQMTNRWYFQKDICKTPLLMFRATAVSLTHPFADPTAKSNNITIKCLNPYLFKNPDFQHYGTQGYSPKMADTNTPLYLYGSNIHNLTYQNMTNTDHKNTIIALTNTKLHTPGHPITSNSSTALTAGNPFHEDYTSGNLYVYISKMTPTDVYNYLVNNTQPDTAKQSITNAGELIYTFRYNPDNDSGATNKAYIVSTASGTEIKPPQNENFILEGFPLHTLFWGWTDWIKKLGETPQFDTNKLVVFESKALNDTTIPLFIPLDEQFLHGYNPYEPIQDETHELSYYNSKNWYPRHEYQKQTINNICLSGPACPRPPWNHYLQCMCKYTVYLKWGGCPKTLEKAYNPCSQSKWPTPDNQYGRSQIQNPNIFPQTELYKWDWEEDYVTKSAIQRIARYTDIDPKMFSISAFKGQPPALQKKPPQSEEEEEEKKLILQLHKLRFNKVLLQLQLQQQLKSIKAKPQ
nr:MAG: ORF1 [TTV-like mini virus]